MTSSASSSEDSDSSEDTGSDEADAPIVTGSSSAPQDLTLGDFFIREGWEEDEVRLPRQQDPVQALTTELSPENSGYRGYDCEDLREPPSAPPLELRLAAESGTLNLTVSQALNSATSDTLLEAKLLADNRTIETITILFEELRTLSVPVDGVSSVKLEISVVPDSASCSTTAVVRDVELTSG